MVVGARMGTQVIFACQTPGKWFLYGCSLDCRTADPRSQLRPGAFRRDCIKQYFLDFSLTILVHDDGDLAYMADDYHVVYHPINYRRRIASPKSCRGTLLTFVILILRISMMFRPFKVFVPWRFAPPDWAY